MRVSRISICKKSVGGGPPIVGATPHDTLAPYNLTSTACNSDGYSYGFNGQFKDNEWAGLGNSLDFGARMYDSRIGRLRSLDPKFASYVSFSPYSFVANDPIVNKEIDGAYYLDFRMCHKMYDHFDEHGGSYDMLTGATYRTTSSSLLKYINLLTTMPYTPEVSWTATAAKFMLACQDNSISFGLTDWSGVVLNLMGAGIAKHADAAGKIAIDVNRCVSFLTLEEFTAFKSSDYYQLYLDNRAGEIMRETGILDNEGKFKYSKLEEWHKEGVDLAETGDKAFIENYKIGRIGGTTKEGAPARYVKDKINSIIDKSRKQAAAELEQEASKK